MEGQVRSRPLLKAQTAPMTALETAIAAARKLEGLERDSSLGKDSRDSGVSEEEKYPLDKNLPPIKTKPTPTPPNEPASPETESPPSHKRTRELLGMCSPLAMDRGQDITIPMMMNADTGIKVGSGIAE
eukprot:TRINITY_DN2303_c0_g1_i1.p1 TRINITY_DN2303_c0_g1~~TRINITY_DN2303_c0_g1_i1.p1  ORF type:complete len:129 (+),score=20.13 TRINITY_DN2303_c0_g1_i1:392-778(+)